MLHQENDKPVLLEDANFTPPARTPWGGRRIRALKHLGSGPVVGESWELSVEPSFPSRVEGGELLVERIAGSPEAWLGAEVTRGGTALLVKLLDSDDALSVQIHPADGWPGLGPDESGKPESWYVVGREPGAGLYLGLAPGADRAAMEHALDRGLDVSALLTFVPVEPGDFFVIEAGTPHCVGPGVFLLEPQHIAPGRRGVTYRYWDWDRRYDAVGCPDPGGEPRALHRERAVAVTGWDFPRGDALLDRVRHRAGPPGTEPTLRLLAGPDAPVASAHLRVARVEGSGIVRIPDWGVLRALTVLEGAVELGDLRVHAGRTAAIPACARVDARCEAAHAIVSGVVVS